MIAMCGRGPLRRAGTGGARALGEPDHAAAGTRRRGGGAAGRGRGGALGDPARRGVGDRPGHRARALRHRPGPGERHHHRDVEHGPGPADVHGRVRDRPGARVRRAAQTGVRRVAVLAGAGTGGGLAAGRRGPDDPVDRSGHDHDRSGDRAADPARLRGAGHTPGRPGPGRRDGRRVRADRGDRAAAQRIPAADRVAPAAGVLRGRGLRRLADGDPHLPAAPAARAGHAGHQRPGGGSAVPAGGGLHALGGVEPGPSPRE